MAARRVAIVQSNYIPWKGYFDLISSVDHFVLYDIVQFTKNDWRNRNLIKTAGGLLWLTIPVVQSGRFGQRIDEVQIANDAWRVKHWRSIEQAYARAPFFGEYRERFAALYLESSERNLSTVNRSFIEAICDVLRIDTPLVNAAELELPDDRVDRLIEICRTLGADEYLSGPAARAYLDVARFDAQGIAVRFIDYEGYPEYPQLHPPFEHRVSALDLLFNAGPDAPSYLLT
jgi:hypothetical protein